MSKLYTVAYEDDYYQLDGVFSTSEAAVRHALRQMSGYDERWVTSAPKLITDWSATFEGPVWVVYMPDEAADMHCTRILVFEHEDRR